jgi:hypothetical protein
MGSPIPTYVSPLTGRRMIDLLGRWCFYRRSHPLEFRQEEAINVFRWTGPRTGHTQNTLTFLALSLMQRGDVPMPVLLLLRGVVAPPEATLLLPESC